MALGGRGFSFTTKHVIVWQAINITQKNMDITIEPVCALLPIAKSPYARIGNRRVTDTLPIPAVMLESVEILFLSFSLDVREGIMPQ